MALGRHEWSSGSAPADDRRGPRKGGPEPSSVLGSTDQTSDRAGRNASRAERLPKHRPFGTEGEPQQVARLAGVPGEIRLRGVDGDRAGEPLGHEGGEELGGELAVEI